LSGGNAVQAGSWGFLAKVNVGSKRACSGALVGPQWIVTTSSCFAVDGQAVSTGTPALPSTATVGRADGSAATERVLQVVRIVPHPNRDVLLAKLSLRVTDVAPIAVSGTAPTAGEIVQAVGYGRSATAWLPERPQAAPAVTGAVTADSFAWTGQNGSGVAACEGDAGGPVFRGGAQPELLGLHVASGRGGCLAESSTRYGGTAARVDDLRTWITQNTPDPTAAFGTFHTSANGIAGYNLGSAADQAVPFDYDHSGKLDHLVLYRPGSGVIWIVKHNPDDTYTAVFHSDTGIANYSMRVSTDRVVAFDYDHSGKLDHLLLYRPGSRTVFILRHGAGATFTTAYSSSTAGIGGYDLADTRDEIMAFDYEHTGKLDHLVLYRPGTGIIRIVRHGTGSTFTSVFTSSTGIANYSLRHPSDRIVAYDHDHSGRPDHLLLYRPGTKTVFILRHGDGTTFTAVYSSSTAGIGGYDLAIASDKVLAYDYERTGRLDHLVLYRPGNGIVYVVRHGSGSTFTPVLRSTTGIGGYDLRNTADRIVAFDDDHSGGPGHLFLYRPVSRLAWVVGRQEAAAPTEPVTVRPVDTADSIVERFAYPGAQEILDTLNVRLISGDGHILLADCATPPVDNVGVVRVWTTEQIGPGGQGLVCFKVTGPAGRLDLEVPGVYEIRGDGQQPDTGHQLTAVVDTASGPPTPVVVNPSGSTQVGIGANPNNEPTTLLQLRVPS
jgi:hypothetical protein